MSFSYYEANLVAVNTLVFTECFQKVNLEVGLPQH